MNKNLFKNDKVSNTPTTDTINEAGGKAYVRSVKSELLQYASTGTFGGTYYASAESELDRIIALCEKVPAKFIAQTAVYCRKKGLMKDTPAMLCAILSTKDLNYLKRIFNDVIDNGRMLRGFITIMRSGKISRTSLGTSVKKLVQKWFDSRSDAELFKDSVGSDGASLADCIKLSHPSPKNKAREALFGYIIGKKVVSTKKDMEKDKHGRFTTVYLLDLPEIVQEYEIYKSKVLDGKSGGKLPNVDFRLLTALNLSQKDWKEIAINAPYQMCRMNLNTFKRHGVFEDDKILKVVADKLSNKDMLKKSKVFPYQLFTAYKNASDIPNCITNALQDAAEIATENIPKIDGKVYVFVDVSGSMRSSVTGNRGTATSKVQCIDVAALVGSSILRNNPNAEVIAFSDDVVPCKLNPRDSIVTNAQKLANLPSGGTACGAPLRALNAIGAKGDLIIYVSDNESWSDMQNNSSYIRRGTSAAHEWTIFKARNPKAKVVCIDITPNSTVQVKDSASVMNIGGFSDSVFEIISQFYNGTVDSFVSTVEEIDVEPINMVVQVAKNGAKKAISKKGLKSKK